MDAAGTVWIDIPTRKVGSRIFARLSKAVKSVKLWHGSLAGTQAPSLNILLITDVDPSHPGQGDEWRAFGLWKGLSQYGSVTIGHWGGHQQGHRGPYRSWLHMVKTLVSNGPPFNTALYRDNFPPVPGRWDMVVAFQLKMARWALAIPAPFHLLDLTDSLGYLRNHLSERSISPITRLKLWGVAEEEVRLGQEFDECWVAAQPDADWLRARGLESVVVPNGVSEVRPLKPGDARHLLFVGNLRYPPNRHGLRHFIKTVWPGLSTRGYHLDVAGRGSQGLAGKGITGHGFVADLNPLYERCGIVVSPILTGSGTPTKVLEALAHARPVVAWESGVTGMTEAQREAIIMVQSSDGWVHTLENLQSPSYRAEVGSRGVKVVDVWGRPQAVRLERLFGSRRIP